MRCKEAIRLINKMAARTDNSAIPPELLEHIKTCPECARAFEAASIMNKSIKDEKQKHIQSTPIAEIRKQVDARLEERKKESIMSIMKNQINRRSGLVTGFSLAVIVFLLITLVPFSYKTTVGYDLVYAGLNDPYVLTGRLDRALNKLGYDNVNIEIDGDNCLIGNLPNKQAALEAAIAFKAVTGSTVEPDIKPIMATVSGSLFAQVKDKMKVEVDTEGKTDEQVADEIRVKLTKIYTNPVVKVTTTGEGRKIVIKTSDSTGDDERGIAAAQAIELLLDNNGDISFETPDKPDLIGLDIDMEGKTEAEIKSEVEAKLAERGEDSAKVEVTTNDEGKKEIKITLEKEKTDGE